MFKFIVAFFIAAVAGFIAYLLLFQNCRDGVVVRSAEACVAQGLDASFCDALQSRLREFAQRSVTVYPNEPDCRDKQAQCVARDNPQGWSPLPSALCVARSDSGRVTRVEPVYEPAGARRAD